MTTTVKKIMAIIAILFSLYIIPGCGPAYVSTTTVAYENPEWAPPYYRGVRYYYLPDVEMYYDLSSRNFVYYNNGDWVYSSMYPSSYGWYDLNNAFVVALDMNVYRPWLHHNIYVTHYPKYYYRNVYEGRGIANVRGFNENQRQPFYWKDEDRRRMNSMNNNSNSYQNRGNQQNTQTQNQQRNQTQNGRNIGEPVKVKPNMREQKERNSTKRGDNKGNNNSRSNGDNNRKHDNNESNGDNNRNHDNNKDNKAKGKHIRSNE